MEIIEVVAAVVLAMALPVFLSGLASHNLVKRGRFRGPVYLLLFLVLSSAYGFLASDNVGLLEPMWWRAEDFYNLFVMFTAFPLGTGLVLGFSTGLRSRQRSKRMQNLVQIDDKRTESNYQRAMVQTLPAPRGKLTENRPLNDLTWLRVGGPADYLFQPADIEDLQHFLRDLPAEVPVFPMGVGSNLIVRDGGLRAVVIRLGRGFNGISVDGNTVTAGAAALDAHVARKAADAGVDLTFLRTIPGSIGGAVRMNAGCYGSYTADVLRKATIVTRQGEVLDLSPEDLNFRYRQSDLPDGAVLVSATFEGPLGDPAELHARMAAQLQKRDETQPTKDRSAGSTFRNPAGFSSTGRADDVHDLKAWKVIDDAGMRGALRGGAQMSPKHSNFLINTGTATAADLEGLGEEVRKKVYETSGITLEWEIMRVGDPLTE